MLGKGNKRNGSEGFLGSWASDSESRLMTNDTMVYAGLSSIGIGFGVVTLLL